MSKIEHIALAAGLVGVGCLLCGVLSLAMSFPMGFGQVDEALGHKGLVIIGVSVPCLVVFALLYYREKVE